MWRCLVFVVAVTLWNLAVYAVPQGDNTCQGVVKHPVKVKVNVTEPVTFRTYTWCLRVPPRCSKYVVQMRERVKEQVEMHNRTITVCCRGYVEMESKCVPACPPMTECPNMHCNRTNHCYCSPGYSGVFCNDPCPKGSWGKDCKKPCDCPEGFTCHHLTGDCMLDDKPSVKTTVRRAFTHISSESVPTTLKPVTITTERPAQSPPTHNIVLKMTPLPSNPTTIAMKNKPYHEKEQKVIIPTDHVIKENTLPPPRVETPFANTIKTSTSTTSTTTSTPKSLLPSTTNPTTKRTLQKISSDLEHEVINFASPTSSPFIPLSPILITNMPPINLFDHSKDSFLTEDTTKKMVTIPQFKESLEINPEIPAVETVPFGQKTFIGDKYHAVTPTNIETTIHHRSSTYYTSSQTTTDGSVILNDTTQQFQTISNIISPKSSDIYKSKNVPAATSKFNTNSIPVPTSTLKNSIVYQEAEITPSSETLPKVFELSTGKPLEEYYPPVVFSTTPSSRFDNLSFTDSFDGSMASMQTPNRNWNPFIPSPGSTKSHGSLTIPFFPNIPVTEVTTTVKTDGTTVNSDKTSRLVTWYKMDDKPSTRGLGEQLIPNLKPPIKTSLVNTFLHSFLQPTDPSIASGISTMSTSMPTLFKAFTVKKPYLVESNFEENPNNPYSQKKMFEHFNPMTPSLISSFGEFTKKEAKKFQDKIQVNQAFTTSSGSEEFITEPTTTGIADKERTIQKLMDPLQTHQLPSEIVFTNKPLEEINKYDQTTEITSVNRLSYTVKEVQQSNSQDVNILDKTLGPISKKKDETLKPSLFYPDKFNPKIISVDTGVSVEPGSVESVNILNKNEFISLIRPKSANRGFPAVSTPIEQETVSGINEFSTVSNTIPSTYFLFDKTVTASNIVHVNPPRVLSNVVTNRIEPEISDYSVQDSKMIVTTPMSPKEINSIVNGKLLEEPSNYLPTMNEKSIPTSFYQNFELKNKTAELIKDFSSTQPPQLGYLPTNKDFLNLTYILNSINDFTSNSKRGGVKQSKSSIYGNPLKVKFTENPALNVLVTKSIYDAVPSTEIFRPISVIPTRKQWKQDSNRGSSHQHKEKNSGNDSKIIHLNISSHLSFQNPTTKFIPKFPTQNNKNFESSYSRQSGFTPPIDGRISTLSIISTVPEIKYQSKRSTKEYSQKTENEFTLNVPHEELVTGLNFESNKQTTQVTTPESSTRTPADLKIVPTVPMKPAQESEEVSKKPFRRKDTALLPFDKLEDVGPNMTAALAAHSSEDDSSVNFTTGILASITCILLLGSLVATIVITLIYCKKEKPLPMESCIMAYEQTNSSDPAAIYSVPRPSLSPEIFFCPTFSHHYAAQINKELRELSSGSTKKENFDPLYTEISIDITPV